VAAAAGSEFPSATGGWRVICAKSSSTVGAGLRLPPAGSPLCPNRLRHTAQRGRKAASPASKGTSSSTHKIET
jgi:hypothetical protein